MIGSLGAQIALVAFTAAILVGLAAGNSPWTITTRALLVMAAAVFVGQAVGWFSRMLLRDHLQRAKYRIDSEHLREVEAIRGQQTELGVDSTEGSGG